MGKKAGDRMRITYELIFALFTVALFVLTAVAKRSHRDIGNSVALVEFSLIFPVAGNFIILVSENELLSAIGCYVYFIGYDFLMFAMVRFSVKYCIGVNSGQTVPFWVYGALIFNTVQLLLNPFTGHAFGMKEDVLEGDPYYTFIPHWGQNLHRAIDYMILLMLILIFFIIVKKMPRIYTEKYSIILVSMIVGGIWQGFYFISEYPINRSILVLFVFGLCIFYFSLCYKPVRLLDRMLSSIASEMSEALFMFDPNGKCIWANEKGCELAECDGNNYDNVSQTLIDMFGMPESQSGDNIEQRILSLNNEIRYYVLEENSVFDENKKPSGSYLSIRDITEEKMKLKRDMYEATHDRLTGLYTSEYLHQRVDELFRNNPERDYLILFVDVKNFKIVNDIFGSEFGDYALQCIAKWVQDQMSDNCVYGRLNGDTFGACIPADEFNSQKIENELSHFVVRKDNAAYQLLIHIGVYAADKKEKDVSVMFDRAHISLSTIQDEYNVHIAFYDNEIRAKLMWNQAISTDLPEAIGTKQICPYLQPIADNNGNIIGAEALARWIHPEHGFMPPSSFIPVFERNGMIVEVDKHMWRCACEVLSGWGKDKEKLFVSVNISPKDFYFMDVAEEIKRLVREYGIAPCRLRIEITETVMMNEADKRMQVLDDLRKAGFIVEMDDFGSGYSSLNMLKDMPVDVLKIDMKFLGKSSDTSKAKTIVKNIINLSEELGISSLTEGVETEEQYHILNQMGCRMFQGYYFSKPLPIEDFEKLLA